MTLNVSTSTGTVQGVAKSGPLKFCHFFCNRLGF